MYPLSFRFLLNKFSYTEIRDEHDVIIVDYDPLPIFSSIVGDTFLQELFCYFQIISRLVAVLAAVFIGCLLYTSYLRGFGMGGIGKLRRIRFIVKARCPERTVFWKLP